VIPGAGYALQPAFDGARLTGIDTDTKDAAMKFVFASLAALALIAWASSPVSANSDGRNITSVNGSVEATDGQTYDTLSTVNGALHVGDKVTANEAKTVNGHLEIGNDSNVGEASTVNGSLDVGDGTTITREASTVNGSLSLGKRTRVGGNASTVSGGISLDGAEVGGSLTTRNGNIELRDGAHVRGGIHVKKENDSGWNWGRKEPLKVKICGTCVVDGELRFERPVVLTVEPGAKIGNVVGDEVTRR
jgi:predicted acyltransferase (DUF342 family)